MTLASGAMLGVYEVVAALGERRKGARSIAPRRG
jgi:hypothetical protein